MWLSSLHAALLYQLPMLFVLGESAKILVYIPLFGSSHVNFVGRLADILVKAGHDVVAFTPVVDREVKTNGTKHAQILRWEEPATDSESFSNTMRNTWGDISYIEFYKLMQSVWQRQATSCLKQLEDEQMMQRLRAEQFDLGISEVVRECGFAIFEKIGLKNYVSALATNLLEYFTDPLGVSSNPSYIPSMFSLHEDRMNYKERIGNFLDYLVMYAIGKFVVAPYNRIYEKHLGNKFNSLDAISRSSFIFTNADELVEFPRLVSPKVIYIGGIAVSKPKSLNDGYYSIMEGSKKGVVLVAFGTIAQSSKMSDTMKNAFIETFRAFPKITFIWKYEAEDDNVIAKLENVVTSNFVPQNDLLGNRNMRAFISHCGQNSLTEAIHAGVPIVCIPLFGDQMRNAKIAEKRGVGIIMDKQKLSADNLIIALRAVLLDRKYRDASESLSKMIRKKPAVPEVRFIKYINFALEFGPITNFDVAGNELNFYQYFLLDIIVPFLITLSVLFYLLLRVVVLILSKVCSFKKVKSD